MSFFTRWNRRIRSFVRLLDNYERDTNELKSNTSNILWTVADKDLFFGGERQMVPSFEMVRADHQNRYFFAKDRISKEAISKPNILDIACGIGYGSYILASNLPDSEITACDISEEALSYASYFYKHKNINYQREDIENCHQFSKKFDAIISYETIEHIPNPSKLLQLISKNLSDNGTAFISTPNEQTMPFNSTDFHYHTKHFTLNELEKMVKDHNLCIKKVYSQHDRNIGTIMGDSDGIYLILELTLN